MSRAIKFKITGIVICIAYWISIDRKVVQTARMRNKTDTTRASRDGHEFHETWTARATLQLLLPSANLFAVAMEGLSVEDNETAHQETIEVADATFYYGKGASVDKADKIVVVQFRYSVAKQKKELRISDVKEVISKFATAYKDFIGQYGTAASSKLQFEIITNRPIHSSFENTIAAISAGGKNHGPLASQITAFKSACDLKVDRLREFARLFRVIGNGGSLERNKSDLVRAIVNISGQDDAIARARLGGLRQLVRDKANSDNQNSNLIRLVDLFGALEVSDERDLLPCPTSFPPIAHVVPRSQLQSAITELQTSNLPLLIHAAGGVGKTVFVNSLAAEISNEAEVIVFDCFGGGVYRAPEDSRHLAKRGLMHIINLLASKGLCDLVLPMNDRPEEVLRVFRKRMAQAVASLRRVRNNTDLILILDAIDNAAIIADERKETPFPLQLLDSIAGNGPIDGLKIVLTCRTHRRKVAARNHVCNEIKLLPFNLAETRQFLSTKRASPTESEVLIAQARSGGNARILEHLTLDSSTNGSSKKSKRIELDDLLQAKIDNALVHAHKLGHTAPQLEQMLAGLAVLPPPVPMDEYAAIHNIETSAVESFASDMCPLLDRTAFGIVFRDEPTETLIRERYVKSATTLRKLAKNLETRQNQSVYACRSLPGLLYRLGDKRGLLKLALSDQFPVSVTSAVGKRNIRESRLRAAIRFVTNSTDPTDLVPLLLEMSAVSSSESKGIEYILANPDLVVWAEDVDAMRRIFEVRTPWPGTRHARLSIISALSGDSAEATRHANLTAQWFQTYYEKLPRPHEIEERPQPIDLAGIVLSVIARGAHRKAAEYLGGWTHWFGFDACTSIFDFLEQWDKTTSNVQKHTHDFVKSLTSEISALAYAISRFPTSEITKQSIKKLSRACHKGRTIKFAHQERSSAGLRINLVQAAAIAVQLGLKSDSKRILAAASVSRPSLWSFKDYMADEYVAPFLIKAAVTSSASDVEVHDYDVLPADLTSLTKKGAAKSTDLRQKIIRAVAAIRPQVTKRPNEDRIWIEEEKRNAELFLESRLDVFVEFTRILAAILRATPKKADPHFIKLIEQWRDATKRAERLIDTQFHHFLRSLGREMALFALSVRRDLRPKAVGFFLDALHEIKPIGIPTILRTIAILTRQPQLQDLAGQQATLVIPDINSETDVTLKSRYYAQLARSMMPANVEESIDLYRKGLSFADEVGSGDSDVTNELLLFTGEVPNSDLSESEIHTLQNLCELNIPDEPEKFTWYAFAKAMSNTCGLKALPKLARWDDRDKAPFEYSLLPFLLALLEDGKIKPELAVALSNLVRHAESHNYDTGSLTTALLKTEHSSALVHEIVKQYLRSHPRPFWESTLETFEAAVRNAGIEDSFLKGYLPEAIPRVKNSREESNERTGGLQPMTAKVRNRLDREAKRLRDHSKALVKTTNACSLDSLAMAIEHIKSKTERGLISDGTLLEAIRPTIKYSNRIRYLEVVCQLPNVNLYIKMNELEECKKAWGPSTPKLGSKLEAFSKSLLKSHIEELTEYGRISTYHLNRISQFTNVPVDELASVLVGILSANQQRQTGTIWLGLATLLCSKSKKPETTQALSRLLNGYSLSLDDKAIDGPWHKEMWPPCDEIEFVAGAIWQQLGSPYAARRWRACHSLRSLASFKRWDVIDRVVDNYKSTDAKPFQAPELPFYFLHARLWLMIALARIAVDAPNYIRGKRKFLSSIALDAKYPHVLIRHFSANALLSAEKHGQSFLPRELKHKLSKINTTPFSVKSPRSKSRSVRAIAAKTTKPEFYFDWDFEKYCVDHISRLFSISNAAIKSQISSDVRKWHPGAKNGFDTGGRRAPKERSHDNLRAFDVYGHYAEWHSSYVVAGHLLDTTPLVENPYEDEPWSTWLSRQLLTRTDGLWLSDGTQIAPPATIVNVLEKRANDVIITGDREKLLGLVGIKSSVGKEFVIDGYWYSPDDVLVSISSVLTKPRDASRLTKRLNAEKPFFAYLPVYSQYEGDEFLDNPVKDVTPWIVFPSPIARLDQHDPFGCDLAGNRPHLSDSFLTRFSLKPVDEFGTTWLDSKERPVLRADVWRCPIRDDADFSGARLACSRAFLSRVLRETNCSLVTLIKLQKYTNNYGRREGQFFHTIGLVEIDQSLKFVYSRGAIHHTDDQELKRSRKSPT